VRSPASVLGLPALTLTFKPDELYRVPTDDGASIALGRYHPRGPRRFADPVVLCHGLGANRFNLDFDERYSVARYLARRGFETWVMELRGRGLAGPGIETTFDEQAEHDVRAAIRTVRSTGAERVLWVGHSKGGLAAFAHGAKNPDAPFRAIVAIGSPITFQVQPGLRTFIRTIAPILKLKAIPISRVRPLAHLGAPPGPLSRYMMIAANMEPLVVKQSLANMACDIPGGVGRQFGQWITTGKFDSFDHSFDYRAHMAGITCPVLLLAGSRDLLAPPMAVARAKEFLGSAAKLVICGKAHGFSADYGHGDLVLGRHSPDEVFPVIETFLTAHAQPHAAL
jgi:pimeloyl-ACP methyl ester carboxylesterase